MLQEITLGLLLQWGRTSYLQIKSKSRRCWETISALLAQVEGQERKENKLGQEKQNANNQVANKVNNKYNQNFSDHVFDNQNELSLTYTAEMMEAEWPMPVPIPERFVKPMAEQHFDEFNRRVDNLPLRPDLEEETDWNIAEDTDSIVNKFPEPIERQSITNSQVFRMSDTEFYNFNVSNDVTDYIEITNEEEFQPYSRENDNRYRD